MFNKRFLCRIAFSLTCGRNQSSTGRKPVFNHRWTQTITLPLFIDVLVPSQESECVFGVSIFTCFYDFFYQILELFRRHGVVFFILEQYCCIERTFPQAQV